MASTMGPFSAVRDAFVAGENRLGGYPALACGSGKASWNWPASILPAGADGSDPHAPAARFRMPDFPGRRVSPGARCCYDRGMKESELLARIAAEPGKMGGRPLIRGRRITPSMVLNMLANGASREAVLKAYAALEPADIDGCLLYAVRLGDSAAEESRAVAAEQRWCWGESALLRFCHTRS
jgi:uncharacterized protein (DUF433 family)